MRLITLVFLLAVTGAAAHAQTVASLPVTPDAKNSYALLKAGQYAPTSVKDGPIEQQRALEASPVRSVAVSFRTDSELKCKADDDIEKVLSAPNRGASDRCAFAAELTVVLDRKLAYLLTAGCGDWTDNVAKCRISRQGGQFWVMRDSAKSPKRFNLILGPSPNDVRFPSEPEGQNFALLIGEVRPAKSGGSAILWLTWPERSVSLRYQRQ